MGTIFLNFRNEINSDYQKYSLTLISEYQKKAPFRRPSPRKLGSGAKVADISLAGRADGEGIMRRLFQDMQRSVLISQGGPGCLNKNSRAGCRNDQPENRDALGASSRRRLLGKRRAAHDSVREMKVTEPVDVEFLQAERLEDFFVLHQSFP
jgi:hypothetical protein